MKILISGATGALGKAVLRALARDPVLSGAEILSIRRAASEGDETATVICDGRDSDAMAGLIRDHAPDLFFHLAWETAHGSYWNDPDNALWADAAIAAARAVAESGRGRYIFAGTCAEYHWTGEGPCDEGVTETSPATLYGAAKLSVSQAIDTMAAQGDLDGFSGRIFFPFSPVEAPQRVTSLVLRHVLEDKLIHLKAADVYRDFATTDAIADAFVALARTDARGVLNVATGEPVHLGVFLRQIADVVGKGELVTWPEYGTGADDQGPRTLHASTERLNAYTRVSPPTDGDAEQFVNASRSRFEPSGTG